MLVAKSMRQIDKTRCEDTMLEEAAAAAKGSDQSQAIADEANLAAEPEPPEGEEEEVREEDAAVCPGEAAENVD